MNRLKRMLEKISLSVPATMSLWMAVVRSTTILHPHHLSTHGVLFLSQRGALQHLAALIQQRPGFVADKAGSYTVALTVTDQGGVSSSANEVVISSSNLAPTANGGPNQLVLVGTMVFLDGSNSTDPELDFLELFLVYHKCASWKHGVACMRKYAGPDFHSQCRWCLSGNIICHRLHRPRGHLTRSQSRSPQRRALRSFRSCRRAM